MPNWACECLQNEFYNIFTSLYLHERSLCWLLPQCTTILTTIRCNHTVFFFPFQGQRHIPLFSKNSTFWYFSDVKKKEVTSALAPHFTLMVLSYHNMYFLCKHNAFFFEKFQPFLCKVKTVTSPYNSLLTIQVVHSGWFKKKKKKRRYEKNDFL